MRPADTAGRRGQRQAGRRNPQSVVPFTTRNLSRVRPVAAYHPAPTRKAPTPDGTGRHEPGECRQTRPHPHTRGEVIICDESAFLPLGECPSRAFCVGEFPPAKRMAPGLEDTRARPNLACVSVLRIRI